MDDSADGVIGLLLSGGLDSSILLGRLLDEGRTVQPFHIRTDLSWGTAETLAVERYTAAFARPTLRPLVTLELPLADLYGRHWSVTGQAVPPADTPDEAVFLPGRNALLLIKAAVWCQMHGLETLALAPLGSNPFADTSPEFFTHLAAALGYGGGRRLEIVRPLAHLHKREVMQLGRDYPLELTFSCIAPVAGLHCGRCNKCGERREAFAVADLPDPTPYAHQPEGLCRPSSDEAPAAPTAPSDATAGDAA